MGVSRRMGSVPACALALGLTTACVIGVAPAEAVDPKSDAVLAANAQFYAALNKLFTGDVSSMTEVWSHADDVTYMGPTGGYDHGWAAVSKDWQGQAALKLGGRVEPADVRVIVGRTVAVVTDSEVGENTNAQGKIEQVRLRATNSYRMENGVWKMVGHHTDPLPYLSK